MKNVKMEVEGNELVIRVDLSKQVGPSKSGKTTIIGTTAGNKDVPEQEGMQIGVNVFKYNE